MSLEQIVAISIAYLLYTLTLAGAVQVAIESMKPVFITPIREYLDTVGKSQLYLPLFYTFRLLLTSIGFFSVWGGVPAVKAVLDIELLVPDYGIAIVTILFVVLGEEVIHPLLDKLYSLKDAVEMLEIEIDEIDEADKPSDIVGSNRFFERADKPLG